MPITPITGSLFHADSHIERLWRSLKHENVYLMGYADGREARAGIGRWIDFYNPASEHPSVYMIEEKRLC